MNNAMRGLEAVIRGYDGPPLRLMEVCGTHTHQISHFGIPSLFPENLELISGPGCPVCVTSAGYIDRAAEIAMRPDVTLLSFGDMLRVPGHETSLQKAKAAGASVLLMYSPMDVVKRAQADPDRLFYVTAVGFETTLPLYALLVERLRAEGIENVRLLVAVKALMPGLTWICENSPGIDGFIGPGHVSAILGYGAYAALCEKHRLPMAVAGFGYEHLIAAIADLIRQAGRGQSEVHNLYPSAVTREGNLKALSLIERCFVRGPTVWRGLGAIDGSGYRLAPAFARYDAGSFDDGERPDPPGCLCGRVIIGRAKPVDCPHYGGACTPQSPIGPCMVSSEGACGIWHANARVK